MSSEGGKIKPKRRQAPTKPYDRNLTLFGKLRKSVKDLLVPSWLLGSHQQNERQATGDACQTAQASPEAPMESNSFSSRTQLHNRAGDGVSTLEQASVLVDCTKGEYYTGKGSGVSSLAKDRQEWALISDKQGQDTSKLLGACSQESKDRRRDLMRSRLSESYLSDTDDQHAETTGAQHIMTSTRVHNQSIDTSQNVARRQRVWSPQAASPGINLLSPVKEKPSFNAVLLGSMSDSAVFGDSFNKSVFYPGKTRFGGASAERRTSLNSSLPYQSSLPLRKQVRAHNVSNNINATTSATAQRILETLDKMSTPLGDAKRMSVSAASTNDSVLSFTPSSYRHASFHTKRPMSRPLQGRNFRAEQLQIRTHKHKLPTRGPPTSQHQALAQAVLAKNRSRSGVVDRRPKPVLIDDEDGDNNHSSQEPPRLSERERPAASLEPGVSLGQQSSSLGKMKVKRFSQHISNPGLNHGGQVGQPTNLRTDFTLPVSSMVPITLQSYTVKSHAATASSIPSSDVPLKFIFSAPIDADEKRQAHCQPVSDTDKNFQFTSPIKTSAAGAEGASKTCQEPAVGASSGMPLWAPSAAFTATVHAWGSTAPKPKVSSPDIGGTSSSFKSYSKWGSFEKPDDSSAASDPSGGFSLAPAASLKPGSVMDILGAGKSASSPGSDDLMAKFKKPAGSWECDACMIVNKPEAARCVCCDTARPGAKPAQAGSATEPISKPSLTGALSGTSAWSASTPANKSISAETPKPGTKQPLNGAGMGSDNSLSALFKKPAGTWECDTCMVQNTAGAVRCIACDSSKPGLQAAGIGMGSDNSLSALFKKPAGTWECDTCMVQNTAGAVRCIACDSSKPGLQAAGIVPKASSNASSAIQMSPAGGFTFNTPAMTTTTSGSGGFKFGNSNSYSTPSSSVPPATGFIFGQTTSSNTDSSSKSSTGSSSSTPLAGGFKFGATSPEGDSGGSVVASSGSGFTFGNNSSNSLPVKANESFQTVSKPDGSSVKAVPASRPDVDSNGTTDLSKSNSLGKPSSALFQFGHTNTSTLPSPAGLQQSGTELNSNDNNSKLPHKEVNFNFAPTSTTLQPFLPAAPQQADKPASSLFQFGGHSAAPVASAGLGMGKSLSDAKPMINGGFGSSFEVQTVKADHKPVPADSSKSFGNFTFGSTSSVFGVFGQTSGPASESAIVQTSQSSKRSVDFSESDQPTAKKSFNFGAGASDHSSNGLFAFGGSSESKASPFVVTSTAGLSAGGFNFNSKTSAQLGGPAPGGGFQFPVGSATAPTLQGFGLSFKAHSDGPNPSFDAATNTGGPVPGGPVSFSATPNFNFGAIQQPTSVFQFGGKVESASPAPGVFAFGTSHPANATSDGPGFGSATGGGPVGSFSIGAGDTGRKMKKGVRRMKK